MSATMKATVAYIDRNTRWDDVDFYVSPLFTPEQLKEFVYQSRNRAAREGVRILEFTVFDGGKEIWRGLV
jgi:hypothetical protein